MRSKSLKFKKNRQIRRHRRIRGKVFGISQKPRLNVFRSNQHIYAQLVDDNKHKTILAVNDLKIKSKDKTERAQKVGENLASTSLGKGIKKVVFDRGGFKYHGLIKTLAEAARSAGLKF